LQTARTAILRRLILPRAAEIQRFAELNPPVVQTSAPALSSNASDARTLREKPAKTGEVAAGGKDGLKAAQLLGQAKDAVTSVMQQVTRTAVARLIAAKGKSGGLYTDQERKALAEALASVTGSADLLGRSRIAERVSIIQRKRVKRFSERSTPFLAFADPIAPMAPEQAVSYFGGLVPTLGTDPKRFGQDQRRKAFTLAVATEQTLLVKVQGILDQGLKSGESQQALAQRVQKVLDQAGVSASNPQYAEMVVRTNMMDSYNTGQQAQMREMEDFFPVWRYDGIRDGREGDDHRPHFGRYYPASASFNEVRGKRPFNCRCTMTPVDQYEWEDLQKQGARVESGWGQVERRVTNKKVKQPKIEPIKPPPPEPVQPPPPVEPEPVVEEVTPVQPPVPVAPTSKVEEPVPVQPEREQVEKPVAEPQKPARPLPYPELDPNRPPLNLPSVGLSKETAKRLQEAQKNGKIYLLSKSEMTSLVGDSKTLDEMVKKGWIRVDGNIITGRDYTLVTKGIKAADAALAEGPIKVPVTMRDVGALDARYSVASKEERQQIATYLGIDKDVDPLTFNATVKDRMFANLNPVPIAEQLKDSPHEEQRKRLLAAVEADPSTDYRKKAEELSKKQGSLLLQEIKLTQAYGDAIKNRDKKAAKRLKAELDQITPESRKVTSELLEARQKSFGDPIAKDREKIKAVLAQPDPTEVKINTHKPAVEKNVTEAQKFLSGLVAKGQNGQPLPAVSTTTSPDGRAGYMPGSVSLADNDAVKTVVHEMGHHIEEMMPGAKRAGLEFLKHRIGNEQPTKMKVLFPDNNYRDDEMGCKDNFDKTFDGDLNMAYYTGKSYYDGGTEIISMGIELMYRDPVGFAKRDPEYFNFIAGILSGKHRLKDIPP